MNFILTRFSRNAICFKLISMFRNIRLQWKEAQKQAEIRKREKREDLIARQRVKEQIARDRADKKAQQEKEKVEVAAKQAPPLSQASSSTKVEHTHARLQVN